MNRDDEIFADALALPPGERAAFLESACNGDATLHARIRTLLAAHDSPDNLLAPRPTSSLAAVPDEKPGDRIGRYKLIQKIGEGGCGVVWMAEQQEPVRRRVALKVIKLGMDTKAVVARFEIERQALALMDHPNIAKVLDGGATDTGRPFFVMELVRGIPITRYCDDNSLSTRERLKLFIQICQAIQHAHQKGIIHRDIKPSNVLVTLHDDVAVPVVIDFGIAKATQGRLTDETLFTAFEQFIGTPVYMSPEQAEYNALDVDTRSDIYSLGVLLYELLAGRPPFDPKALSAAGIDHVRQIIRESEPPRPSLRLRTLTDEERTTVAKRRGIAPAQLSTMLRGDLDWIVMKALEKNRVRRYQTANAFAADLQRHLANEPVVARPPRVAYRFGKFVVRHKVGFAAGSLVAAAVLAGLAFSTIALIREKSARARALAAEQAERDGRQRAEAAEAAARASEQLGADARHNAERLLAFVLNDMGDQLDEIGQMPLLRKLAAEVLAYYEQLNPALHTRETRAGHALAMTGMSTAGWLNVGRSSEFQLGEPAARQRLEHALATLQELEATGPLTPFMRVAYAGILWSLAGQYHREGRPAGGVPLLATAEDLLQPAIADPRWGGWADRFITKLILGRAALISSSGWGRSEILRQANSEFRRALARVEGQLRTRPDDRGLQLVAIEIKQRLWVSTTDREEARRLNASARAEAAALLTREPFLISARTLYALCCRSLVREAQPHWRFDEMRAHLEEAIQELRHVAKSDPGGWPTGRNFLLDTLAGAGMGTSVRYRLHWLFGEFVAAEADLLEAIAAWSEPTTTPDNRLKLVRAHESLARLLAATGRDADADEHLRSADAALNRLIEERRWLTEPERQSFRVEHAFYRVSVEVERLNWTAVREMVQGLLPTLPSVKVGGDAPLQPLEVSNARWALLFAALALNDHPTARRELAVLQPTISLLPSTANIDSRFVRLRSLLNRIDARLRLGEPERARAELVRSWPEVEAIFAAGPDYLFNQVQTARALSLRAELGDADIATKRGWLERAAGLLRPAAASGKLTRYEREVLLAGVEKQLAALASRETK